VARRAQLAGEIGKHDGIFTSEFRRGTPTTVQSASHDSDYYNDREQHNHEWRSWPDFFGLASCAVYTAFPDSMAAGSALLFSCKSRRMVTEIPDHPRLVATDLR
jgi:hypothetical protein